LYMQREGGEREHSMFENFAPSHHGAVEG